MQCTDLGIRFSGVAEPVSARDQIGTASVGNLPPCVTRVTAGACFRGITAGVIPATNSGEARLRREVGPIAAVFVTINAMVGTGIFRLAPAIVVASGGLGPALAAWVLGGVVALAGALCVAEVGSAMPRAGGLYEILRRAYGPSFAFWFGWTRLWLLGPSAAGSFARLAAESMASLLGLGPNGTRDTLLAAGVLVGCTLANLLRVRLAARGQGILSSAKLVGLLGLAALCFGHGAPAMGPGSTLGPTTATGFFTAFAAVMWAYDGWADVSSLSGELSEPGRTLPIALCVGTALVTVAYLALNLGYAHVLGEAGLVQQGTGADMVAVRAAISVLGAQGRGLISALILVSCIGACLTGVLTGSRVFVSMASDRLLFRAFAHVPSRSGVPVLAVTLSCLLGVAYLSVRSFEQLTNAFVVGMFPFYTLAILAVPVLRVREAALIRPFRAPWMPFCVGIFGLGALFVMLGALGTIDTFAAISLGFMLLGLPIGRLVAARTSKSLVQPR
jgi:APA family basic amino acid/polyamine antiporter